MLEKSLRRALYALCACALLSGCNSSSSTTPNTTYSNISGDYTGTVTDSVHGAYAASGTLAQHANTAGGNIAQDQSGTVTNGQVILSISTANAVSGTMVIDYASGTTCTFGMTGTYDTGTNVLSGSYTNVTGCSGQSGTYSLTQQCTDTVTSVERRRMSSPAAC